MYKTNPAQIQPFEGWYDVEAQLQDKRVEFSLAALPSGTASTEVDGHIAPAVESHSGVSEAQFECVRSHRHGVEHLRTAGVAGHPQRHIASRLALSPHQPPGRGAGRSPPHKPEKHPTPQSLA